MQWIASLLFTGFLFAWTFSYAVFFVVACVFLPVRGRFALARLYARSVLAVLRLL